MVPGGTIIEHDMLVRELDARGYPSNGGAFLRTALDRFLGDNGYPADGVRQLADRSVLFTGASEGAAELLIGAGWYGVTSQPRNGRAADLPAMPQLGNAEGLLALAQDPRVVRGVLAVGAGALILGVALAAAKAHAEKKPKS